MAKHLEHVVVQQTAPCAISNSCVMPGPRVAVPHSNLKVCPMHARTLELPSGASGAGELAGTRSFVHHAATSREPWDLMLASIDSPAGPWARRWMKGR